MSEITFRPTQISDGALLTQWLDEEGVLDGFPMEDAREVKDAVDYWMQFCALGSSITALIGDKVCGVANLYLRGVEKISHHCLFVIVVDKAYRGRGIGKALIEQLEELAKTKFGIKKLFLEIYEGNRAINLYRRLGFKEVGVQESFLIDRQGKHFNKIVMEKSLK